MHYTPGLIAGGIGVIYLVLGLVSSDPALRQRRIIRGLVGIAIGVVVFLVFANR